MAAIGHRQNSLGRKPVLQLASCNRSHCSHRHSWGMGQRRRVVDCTKAGGVGEAPNWMERMSGWPGVARKSVGQALEGLHIAESAGAKTMEIGALAAWPQNYMFAYKGCSQRPTVAATAVAERSDTVRDYMVDEPSASVE
jgi:hypothetical protein